MENVEMVSNGNLYIYIFLGFLLISLNYNFYNSFYQHLHMYVEIYVNYKISFVEKGRQPCNHRISQSNIKLDFCSL